MNSFFRNKKVDIYSQSDEIEVDDYGGRSRKPPSYLKSIKATVQPFTSEMLMKSYGYDVIVTKVMYCDIEPSIKEHTILKIDGVFYQVKKHMDWNTHMEVFMDGI